MQPARWCRQPRGLSFAAVMICGIQVQTEEGTRKEAEDLCVWHCRQGKAVLRRSRDALSREFHEPFRRRQGGSESLRDAEKAQRGFKIPPRHMSKVPPESPQERAKGPRRALREASKNPISVPRPPKEIQGLGDYIRNAGA